MSKSVKHCIIIGAGLAGSILAHKVSQFASVTVIEGGKKRRPPFLVTDTNCPANIDPHVGGGIGGSTNLWHNGLINIPDSNLRTWPVDLIEIKKWLNFARPMLGGMPREELEPSYKAMANKFKQLGFDPELFGDPLHYPSRRINAWRYLHAGRNARLIKGTVSSVREDMDRVIVEFDGSSGRKVIEGDCVIISAGGLGTPAILNKSTINGAPLDTRNVGCFYEDHPLAFVAEFNAPVEMSYLGNFAHESLDGRLRMPLVVHEEGIEFAFFVRPVFKWATEKKERVRSNLSNLRNNPYSVRNYVKLVSNGGDLIDLLSFKFGMHVKTTRFSLLMVSGIAVNGNVSVHSDSSGGTVFRNWEISSEYVRAADRAIRRIVEKLGGVGSDFEVYTDWASVVQSSAHHSGTARMASCPRDGVCNANNLVFGSNRIYICDGSVIPDSGYANTGLTIAALALRLSNHLEGEFQYG